MVAEMRGGVRQTSPRTSLRRSVTRVSQTSPSTENHFAAEKVQQSSKDRVRAPIMVQRKDSERCGTPGHETGHGGANVGLTRRL